MPRLMRYQRATTLLFLVFASVGMFQTPQSTSAMQSGTPIDLLPCPRAWEEVLSSKTRTLTTDCVTESAITIPAGWTFEGGGHTIYVVDPVESRFRGPVIDVRAGLATIQNVTIDGSALSPGCAPESTVVGVLFAEAGGTIWRTTIVNIERGQGNYCGYGAMIGGTSPAPVRVMSSTIQNPGNVGIIVLGRDVTVSSTTISNAGGSGIVVGGSGASGTITDNTIRTPGGQGISIEDAAKATLTGNDIMEPGLFGMLVSSSATAQITNGNRITSGIAGILISDPGTSVTVDGNEIVSPIKDGIYVQSGAEATVSNNAITNSGGSGITVSQPGTRGQIRDNVIEKAAVSGILVQNQAEANVIGNIVHGPGQKSVASLFGPVGIRYAIGANGQIRENSISGYLSDQPASIACAIAIDFDVRQVEVGPNTFPAPGNASDLCKGTPSEAWTVPSSAATPATPVP
jgi:hypothetical protein